MAADKKIYSKLLEFQTSIEIIKKDGKNPFFKKADGHPSTYATLPKILSEVKPILNALKIVVTQPIVNNEVLTILTDTESGESIQSGVTLPLGLNAQQIGSAVTYYRRYTISSLLSLEIDEDDDGNIASGVHQEKKPNITNDERAWLTEKQFNSALERITKGEHDLLDNLKATFRMKKEYKEKLELASKQQ